VYRKKWKHWMSTGVLLLILAGALGVVAAGAEDDAGRKVKTRVSPTYPELARKMNLAGTVKVEVVVAPNGVVKSTKVIGGHPVLVEPALDAVKRWRFEPAPADTTTTVEFRFNNNQ